MGSFIVQIAGIGALSMERGPPSELQLKPFAPRTFLCSSCTKRKPRREEAGEREHEMPHLQVEMGRKSTSGVSLLVERARFNDLLSQSLSCQNSILYCLESKVPPMRILFLKLIRQMY